MAVALQTCGESSQSPEVDIPMRGATVLVGVLLLLLYTFSFKLSWIQNTGRLTLSMTVSLRFSIHSDATLTFGTDPEDGGNDRPAGLFIYARHFCTSHNAA